MGFDVCPIHPLFAKLTRVVQWSLIGIELAEWIARLSRRQNAFGITDICEIQRNAHGRTGEHFIIHFFFQLELVLVQGIFRRWKGIAPMLSQSPMIGTLDIACRCVT